MNPKKSQTFEEYLQNIHAEACIACDDDMPEAYDYWLSVLDIDDILGFARSYGELCYKNGKIAGLDRASEIMRGEE